jgi:hypothetical protein
MACGVSQKDLISNKPIVKSNGVSKINLDSTNTCNTCNTASPHNAIIPIQSSQNATFISPEEMYNYFEKCLKTISLSKKTHTPEELKYFERKLVDKMHILYNYIQKKKESNFLLNCAWQVPDLDLTLFNKDYDRFMREILALYRVITMWLNGDEKIMDIVKALHSCAIYGTEPPNWVQLAPSAKILKTLYSRHIKNYNKEKGFTSLCALSL